MHKPSHRWDVVFLAIGIVLASTGRTFAARLVPIALSVNGKVAMKASWGDNGHPGPDHVWEYLKNAKFECVKNFAVEPDPQDPLRAKLTGKVVLDVAYGGRADVSELRLVRPAADAAWQVAPEEIERTFKIRHKPFVFRITAGGTPVFWTVLRTRTGTELDTPDNVWAELKRLTLIGNKVTSRPEDPQHGTLEGGVTITLFYAGEDWGHAEMPQLKLIALRRKGQWRVEPAEVDRALQSRTRPE